MLNNVFKTDFSHFNKPIKNEQIFLRILKIEVPFES